MTETAKDPGPRIVSFNLMPEDPDYYFVLTEALTEFAASQRSEAEDLEGPDAAARIKWAETASAALEQIEETLSTPAAPQERQQMKARDALVAVRREALESLIGRIARRYALHPAEISVLLDGLEDLTEERITVMHQMLDRAMAAGRCGD